MPRRPLQFVVTIDVEEEGLFSGSYDHHNVSTRNVASLACLDPLFREYDIRPTLLVTYGVAQHRGHQDLLLELNGKWRGEIGAHLHHWNTPPLEPLPYPDPAPSELMPSELLTAKLNTLLETLSAMSVNPVSFRMGRFNLGKKMLSVLENSCLQVDSSIAPMRRQYGGPAHLSAPTDPYFPDTENPCVPGTSRILEVPMTILPLVPGLGSFLERLTAWRLLPESGVNWFAKDLVSLPAQPFWTGLRRLKVAVRLHQSRRGRVITMFFHSSELMPGGSPQHRTEDDVRGFLNKLARFFAWLREDMGAHSVTLAELADTYRQGSLQEPSGS